MGGRALLSRIGARDTRPIDSVESIAANLRALLNTRKGDCVTAPDFGILDFADVVHDFPGGIQQLAKSIRTTVLQYEPRLKNLAVRHVPDENPLTLRFEITAQVAEGKAARTLRFATTVKPGGRVDVAG
ncbi:MAG TPA: type VI secretion system baseplate subunit TssE [Anaeromyxobacter sp.]